MSLKIQARTTLIAVSRPNDQVIPHCYKYIHGCWSFLNQAAAASYTSEWRWGRSRVKQLSCFSKFLVATVHKLKSMGNCPLILFWSDCGYTLLTKNYVTMLHLMHNSWLQIQNRSVFQVNVFQISSENILLHTNPVTAMDLQIPLPL